MNFEKLKMLILGYVNNCRTEVGYNNQRFFQVYCNAEKEWFCPVGEDR